MDRSRTASSAKSTRGEANAGAATDVELRGAEGASSTRAPPVTPPPRATTET